MQDLVQLGMDEELSDVFDGLSAGSKVKMVVEVTISEIDDERFTGTIDRIHEDVEMLDEGEEYEPEEDSEEEEPEEDSEEEEYEYEEDDEE